MKKIFVLLFTILILVMSGLCSFAGDTDETSGDILSDLKSGIVKFDFKSVEAEDVVRKNFSVVEDKSASGGKYLVSESRNSSNSGGEEKDISFDFYASSDSKYSIYIRLRFESRVDSIFYGADFEPCGVVYASGIDMMANTGEWVWWRECFVLKKGNHTIKVNSRVPGVLVDKIIVTNSPIYYPNGLGDDNPDMDIFNYNPDNVQSYKDVPPAPYTPRSDHPRLFVNKEDIPGIKERINNDAIHKLNYEQIKKFASRETDCCVMPPLKSGQTTNYNAIAPEFIEDNAFLYLVDKDVEAGRKAIEGSIKYVTSLDVLRAVNITNTSRTEIASLLFVAEAYDWCYDLMTEDEKKVIVTNVMRILTCGEVMCPPDFRERAWHQGHWSEGELINTQFGISIAFYDEVPQFYNIIGGVIFSDFVPVKNYLYDNSARNVIGTGYGREIYEAKMLLLAKKMGAPGVFTNNFKWWYYSRLYEELPCGGFFPDGDHSEGPGIARVNDSHMFYIASIYDDPLLMTMAKESIGPGVNQIGGKVYFLLWDKPELERVSTNSLPLSIYSGPLTGTIVSRTGWTRDPSSDDLLVYMKMPENFFEAHGHADAGSFQIYYKGMLALDSGAYYLYNSDPHRWYYTQTLAHNCILIDNPANAALKRYPDRYTVLGGQNGNTMTTIKTFEEMKEKSEIGKTLGVAFGGDQNNPSFSYLKGDLTKAYNNNAEKYTRTFMFFNFFDKTYPGALIVFDKINANTEYKRTWLLHTQQEPEISEDKKTQIVRRNTGIYNGRLINKTILPKNINLDLIGGDGYEYFSNGVNHPDKETEDSGKWRIEISPKSAENTEYFLNVMQMSDDDKDIEPLEVVSYETDTHIGVQIKDRVAFLSKNEKRTARDISFEFNSDTVCDIAVDGLTEGTWRVLKNETEIGKYQVTKRGGIINFKSDGGKFLLKYYNREFEEIPLPLLESEFTLAPEEEVVFKVNGIINNKWNNELIVRDNEVYAPFEEYVKKIGCGNALTVTDDSYKLTFIGKTQEFKFDDLEKINGVNYIRIKELEDVLTIKTSYNPAFKLGYTNTLFIVNGSRIKNSKEPNRIAVKEVIGDAAGPEKTLNGLKSDYYASQVNGAIMMFEFEKPERLEDISIEWGSGYMRNYNFELYVSSNGVDFEKVFGGESSGTTAEEEFYPVGKTDIKYVKLLGYGNSVNKWTNITNIRFYRYH